MLEALVFVFLSAVPPAAPPSPEPWATPEQSVVFGIEKGDPARTSLLPPAEGYAHLLLVLERPRPIEPLGFGELQVALYPARGKKHPVFLLPTAERIYAAFFDLPAGPQRLVAGGKELYLADRMIELRSGETRQLTLGLARKPDVRVLIELPESERRSGQLSLEMRPLEPPGRLPPWRLEAEAEEALLERVPPVDAEFVLRSPRWTFRSPLDLSRGKDRTLFFDPDETELHGFLTLGGRPATGRIHFQLPDQGSIEVATDERGWYDAFLWRRGLYQVAVEIGRNPPYRFYYDLQEVARKVLDIDVPTARYQVRAVDRATRRTLRLKKLKYAFRDEEDRLLEGEVEVSGSTTLLPPLGAGRIDLFLMAEGYVEREWKGFELAREGPGATWVAELDRIDEWVSLILLDAGSEPVEHVQARVLRDGFSDQVLWEGRSSSGELRVPGQYRGLPILVRAPGFACHADLLPEPTPSDVVWQLEKARPHRSWLVVVDEESRPVAGADVALRIGPVWLRGDALAWLAGSTKRGPRTDGDGLMMLRNLPPRKLLTLARAGSFDPAELEGLAYHATTLESPAPPILIVPVSP